MLPDSPLNPAPPPLAVLRRDWRFRSATFAILSIYVLSAWVPWQPTYPHFALDGSWVLALHRAFLRHTDFGRTFVFTFGPWGFLYTGFAPQTYLLTVLAWSAMGCTCLAGLTQVAWRRWRSGWAGGVWLVAMLALLCIGSPYAPDVRMFTLIWLLLIHQLWGDDRPLGVVKTLLTIAVGLITLIKFSMFVPGIFVVAAVTLHQLRRRQVPTVAIIFCVAHASFWLFAHQSVTAYGPYLQHSFEIIAGYPQGEAQNLPSETSDVLCFVSVAATTTALVVFAHRRKPCFAACGLVACVLAFTLLLKTGFVRHDSHEIFATTALAVLALLSLPTVWPDLPAVGRAVATLGCAGALLLASISYGRYRDAWLPRMAWTTLSVLPGRLAAAGRWCAGDADLDGHYRYLWKDAAQNARDLHLPNLSIDTFGFSQWVLMEGGVDYDPRPILQSYLAYTPTLSRLNAEFLQGPRGPQLLLMQVVAIDNHYPSMEDALSWLPLLSNYTPRLPVDPSLPVLPLQRLPRARDCSFRFLEQTQSLLRQMIPVPQGAPAAAIWAQIDLPLSPKGWLLQAAFKAPPLDLVVETADGTRRVFRLIPANARGGFLLSPAVLNNSDFAALALSSTGRLPANQQVAAIAVVPDPTWWVAGCYRMPFTVRFQQLVLGSATSANPR